jgi:hypothetical protein
MLCAFLECLKRIDSVVEAFWISENAGVFDTMALDTTGEALRDVV